MLKRLILHSSHYTLGSLLVTMASIVSFPIFTRTFSVADYGSLNLLASMLLLWTGIGKLGVQQSITRFQGEVSTGHRPLSEHSFVSTVLIGMAATGAIATVGWMIMGEFIPASLWHDDQVAALLVPVSALVVVRVLDSAVSNLMRAQQRSLAFNVYAVLRKYIGLAVILVLILGVMPGLKGFYAATFAVESVSVGIAIAWLLKKNRGSGPAFDMPTYRLMVAFGVPMIAFEIAGLVLNMGDRYVLQALMGAEAVGHYSAAYNFSDYVRTVVFTSFSQAITPLYVRMWEEQGAEATSAFVERSLKLYFMVSAAVVAGMIAVGGSILTSLASDKYAEANAVIPFVIIGMAIDGGLPYFSAGMYIHRKNRRIIPWVVAMAVINIVLNLVLVPRWGIVGSAFATLVSYIVLTACAWLIGRNYMKIRFPFGDLAKFSVLAFAMYEVVVHVSVPGRFLDIAVKVLVGVVVYALLVLAFDATARTAFTQVRRALAARFARGGA